MDIIVVVVAALVAACAFVRILRRDYPLSSGAVDYKRIAWPVGRSGVVGPLVEVADDAFPLRYTSPYNPPQNGSVIASVQQNIIWSNSNSYVVMTETGLMQSHDTFAEWNKNRAGIPPYCLDAQNRPFPLPEISPSSDYTPILEDTDIVCSDEPYAPDEQLVRADTLPLSPYTGQPYDPEWAIPLVKGGIPAPRIDRRLISKEY